MANPCSKNLIMMKQVIVDFQHKLTFLTTIIKGGTQIRKCEMKLTSFESNQCNGHCVLFLNMQKEPKCIETIIARNCRHFGIP
jgi:hypothetical protein